MLSDEPKKRGRPPKVVEVAVDPEPIINPEPDRVAEAQAFAQQVWDSQSPDKARWSRLERVALALKNRGYSMEGIKL